MIDVIEIGIEEFEKDIYGEYLKLFAKDEIRELYKLKNTYNKGIEKIFKIVNDDVTVGFFLLEKLEEHPYYLDYVAIYEKYQNKGYGQEAIKEIMKKVENEGLMGEIEKVEADNPITLRRFEFYKRLGFRKIQSEYLLYDVLYNPLVYRIEKEKEEIDKLFFDYYKVNSNEGEFEKKCFLNY